MSGYPAYEVHGHRDNGEVFDVAVLGRLPDTDAFGLGPTSSKPTTSQIWTRPFVRPPMWPNRFATVVGPVKSAA
jgi:hypothetical protein